MTTLHTRPGRKTLLLFLLISALAIAANASIRGIVLDENGAPLAKVAVRVYAQETPRERAARIVAGKVDREPMASAQTADDGSFKLDVTSPVVELVASATGRSTFSADVADGEDAGTIVLRKPQMQSGRVTAGGKPVADAIVMAGPVVIRTSKEGTFEIERNGNRISVFHPEYAFTTASFTSADRTLDLQLTSGITIRGRVLQADGRTPVARAKVSTGAYTLTETGDDGSFALAHVPPNWRFLRVISGDAGAIASRNSATSYELKLRPLGSIAGSVRDSKTRAGVAGMRVALRGEEEADSTITDAKGNFTFTSVPPGRYDITSEHPLMQIETRLAVSAAAGEKVSVAAAAIPLHRINGMVIDEQKKPVAAATVYVPVVTQSGGSRNVATNAKGEFSARVPTLVGMGPAYIPSMLSIRRDGYVPAIVDGNESGDKPLVVTLRRGVPVDVKVVDGEKKPIAKVTVDLSAAAMSQDLPRTMFLCDSGRCITNDEGAFTVRVIPGALQVSLSGPVVPKTINSLRVDEKTTPVTLVAERGVPLAGHVVYSDGSPAVDVAVILRADPNIQISVQSDSGGSFRFANAPRGAVTLAVRTPGSGPMFTGGIVQSGIATEALTKQVNAPADDVVLTMPPSGRVTGTVVDSTSRRPITDFQIATVTGGPARGRSTPFSSTDGAFTLEHVQTGKIDLAATAIGFVRGQLNGIEVIDGKTATVELRLDPAGRVVGHVSSRDGSPLSGVYVSDVERSGGAMMGITDAATSDSNGEFKLESVPPGEQRIAFTKQGFLRQEKSVESGPGKESRLDVVLDQGLELRGRVVDESGQAVPMVSIQMQASGEGANGRSDGSGTFSITGLRDLHYSLIARKNGFVDARMDDVVPASSAPVTLTMRRGGSVSGRVTNIPAGATFVNVSMNGDRVFRGGRVDVASGTFTIAGVPDGNFVAEATASVPGGNARRSAPVQVVVANGVSAPIEIAFTTDSLTIQGRVTMQGQPLAGGNVVFQPSTPSGTYGNSQIAADGSYTISGIAEGNYRVVVNARGATLYTQPYTVSSSTVYDIDVHAGSLRGRVTNADTGAAVANARVSVAYLDKGPMYVPPASTDMDGVYSFDPLVEGRWRVSVLRDGFRPEIRELTVTGPSTQDVQLSAGAKLTVMLVDANDGRAVTGMVSALDAATRKSVASVSTTSDGKADLWLAPGSYMVTPWASQYFADAVSVTAPGADVRIPMQRSGRVVVRWTRPGVGSVGLRNVPAAPAPGVGGVTVGTRRSQNGTFENLRPGQYIAQLLGADGKALAELPATVVGGQTATVVFP